MEHAFAYRYFLSLSLNSVFFFHIISLLSFLLILFTLCLFLFFFLFGFAFFFPSSPSNSVPFSFAILFFFLTFSFFSLSHITFIILFVVFSTFFTDQTEIAFSNLRFWQSAGYVIVFGWGPFLDFEVKCILLAIVLVVGMLCLVVLHVKVISIDYQGKTTEEDSQQQNGYFIGTEEDYEMENGDFEKGGQKHISPLAQTS